MTRTAFETALDTYQLFIKGNGAKQYLCRRNGQTRTWKRDPARFEIPIKFRFRDSARITDRDFNSGKVDQWFRILTEEPANG